MRHPLLILLSACALSLAVADTSGAEAPAAAKGGDRDCSDFSNQARAQDFFESHNPGSDPHGLDADGDGIACESNPCPCDNGGGGNGGNNGGSNEPGTKRDRARVIRVVDGDTVRVNLKGKTEDVRLVGIDTPEVFGGEECGGPEASASARDLLPEGATVRLISDPTQDNRDRFGRLLRYVERGGEDVNRTQVARGWADLYVFGDEPFKRVKPYRSARAAAKRDDRGVWGQCGGEFRS